MKVLIATDGSDFGTAAVETAANHFWPNGAELKVISVFDPPVPMGGELYMIDMKVFEDASKAAEKAAYKFAEEAAEMIKRGVNGDNVSVTTGVLTGAPHRRIVEEAEEWGADLIMIGSHGYSMWERVLLGSVSQNVAQHAKCSVWIVRVKK